MKYQILISCVLLIWSVGSHAQPNTAPTTCPTLAAKHLVPTIHVSKDKGIIVYIQKHRGDGVYLAMAPILVEQLYKTRPINNVMVMIWPDRLDEKDTSWIGETLPALLGSFLIVFSLHRRSLIRLRSKKGLKNAVTSQSDVTLRS